ncbi:MULTISPECIES: hypothetical protein [Bacillus cereus group]|uniref:Uncharacterized protein n=1 Tax=Bacillus cereus 03BB108 TaxID=451709 RepID=A0AAN0W4Y9_BACCE|nr:hypothetical protein [Bacillus cereus]AJI08832.1 hypothetical protein AK40_5683 [Bacillus cereus 03BB108]EDX60068.1 hypothetical protein BC03BB108_B0326 [Bacillus cereus 03BB108]QKG99160.1 hypothetical protein FOC96_02580 [Bacillus cereus]HDR7254989.1 hypothetical protein [Bacillus pacificus]
MDLHKFMTPKEVEELQKLRETLDNAFTKGKIEKTKEEIDRLLNKVEERIKKNKSA